MALFRFYGRILPPPPAVTVTMKDIPRVHWEDEHLGLRLDISMSFVDSEVIVTCESNLYSTNEDLSEVYKRVFDTARAAVDCFSYLNGMGLSVILERVIPPSGIQNSILVTRPDLAKHSTAFNIENFQAMYGIVLGDPSILLALNDLIASIGMSHHAPINCGRVIETIREVMTPTGADREFGWKKMRENLNIESDYLKFITNISTAPRHGRRVGTTSQEEFNETIVRSWVVMNRFLEYKKRGEKKLPLADFPALS